MKIRDKSTLRIGGSDWPRRLAITSGVFALCLLAGIASGTIFKKNTGEAEAASASITVTDNDQVVDVDQSTGTTTIRKTSTVNIKDPAADKGYVLTAKLAQTDLAGITTTIHSTSPASIHCTETNPCPVTSDKPISVLYPVHNANATTPQGETTTLNITMIIPAGKEKGSYTLDIEYQEEPVIPIQEVDATTCTAARSIAYDARNSEIYYIQKIPNSGQGGTDLCWMESNLRYGGDGNYDPSWNYPDDRYATTAINNTASLYDDTKPLIAQTTNSSYIGNSPDQATAYTVAAYADPHTLRPTGTAAQRGSTDYTNTFPSGGFYGYLYNWCSAMGGQTNSCNDTSTTGFDTTTSICPAGWRLPTGRINGDYDMLNKAVNGGAANTPQGLFDNFLAVYSGSYSNALVNQGTVGRYWSSTVFSPATGAYGPGFDAAHVSFNGGGYDKAFGYTVRCVKDVTPKTLEDMTYLQDLALAENTSVCANTPDRTRVTLKDRRNGQDYYVEKISNLCWMETNLRYAGDGNWDSSWNYPDDRYATNTALAAVTASPYDDAKPLIAQTANSGYIGNSPNDATAYTVAAYADPYTLRPTGTAAQRGSLDYTNTSPSGGFYGYLYNWCSAMGGQTGDGTATAASGNACAYGATIASAFDTTISICPAGWRLPTGGDAATTDFKNLNNAVNGGTPNTDQGLRDNSLAVYSGFYYTNGLNSQGNYGGYWSSIANNNNAHYLSFVSINVYPGTDSNSKNLGYAVRCVR